MQDIITLKNKLKQKLLSQNPPATSKYVKNSTIKSSKDILVDIYNRYPKYRYNIFNKQMIKKFLKTVLLDSFEHYISYFYTKDNILYIAVTSHTAKSEIYYQSDNILGLMRKFDIFKDIDKIRIYIDKNYKTKQDFKPLQTPRLKERSFGIFDNCLSNKQLHKKMENIRKLIISHHKQN